MSDWQPIETAPKDGTEILGLGKDWGSGRYHVKIARFHGGFWYAKGSDGINIRCMYLTHFILFTTPPPPTVLPI